MTKNYFFIYCGLFVSPVISAFHSCCLSHHLFWPSKTLAGLGRNWNCYLLTKLTWNGSNESLFCISVFKYAQIHKRNNNFLKKHCELKMSIILFLSFPVSFFFTPVTTGGFSFKSEWHQVYSDLFFSKYFSRSCSLNSVISFSGYQTFKSFLKPLRTVPIARITIGISVTLMFQCFFLFSVKL